MPRARTKAIRRLIAGSAGLVAPLHGDRAYRLGARVQLEGAGRGRLRVLMNDQVLGSWDLTDAFADYEVPVPVETVRPGRNGLRFRRPGEGPWAGEIAVAGAWAEPVQP